MLNRIGKQPNIITLMYRVLTLVKPVCKSIQSNENNELWLYCELMTEKYCRA